MSPPRLAIDNLSVRIGGIDAVRDVSLSIAPGQIFGVAGESGSCLLYTSPSPRD